MRKMVGQVPGVKHPLGRRLISQIRTPTSHIRQQPAENSISEPEKWEKAKRFQLARLLHQYAQKTYYALTLLALRVYFHERDWVYY